MKTNTKRLIFLNSIGCIIFLSQPIWLPTAPPGERFQLLANPTVRDFMANALMLGFFYLNHFVLIPKFYFRKKHVLYVLAIIAGLLLICLLPSILTGRNPLGLAADRFPPMPGGHGLEGHGASNSVPPHRGDGGFFQEIKHH